MLLRTHILVVVCVCHTHSRRAGSCAAGCGGGRNPGRRGRLHTTAWRRFPSGGAAAAHACFVLLLLCLRLLHTNLQSKVHACSCSLGRWQGRADVARVLLNDTRVPHAVHKDGYWPIHRACWGRERRHADTVAAFLEVRWMYHYLRWGGLCGSGAHQQSGAGWCPG